MKKPALVVVPAVIGLVALSTLFARTEQSSPDFGRYEATPNITQGGLYITDRATNLMYCYDAAMELKATINLSQTGQMKLDIIQPNAQNEPPANP